MSTELGSSAASWSRCWATLQQLYDVFVRPWAVDLPSAGGPLAISPHEELFRVPFSALVDRTVGTFLVQHYDLSLFDSARSLVHLAAAPFRLLQRDALLIGNVDMPFVRGPEGKIEQLPPLSTTQTEVDLAFEALSGGSTLSDDVTRLSGSAAEKSVVLERLRTAQVVHIATHGALRHDCDVANPHVDGCLALSRVSDGVPDDKRMAAEDFLVAGEVQELNMEDCVLVVLSACSSGAGRIHPEGVLGMPRAFRIAGARSVIATRWAVEDLGMRMFYEEWLGSDGLNGLPQCTKAQALSKAIRLFIHDHQCFENGEDAMWALRQWASIFLIGFPGDI
eukprot:TRINITY_DN1930_c0_g1_i1.p1 TRINITY_DN1930_c0_g1~~TRINITY_DN1930_c0_g1_i1.p1  ORF type:complete len:336 (+),score=13.25 TRINITY_DN1930_c0_g1_i1:814-1821(+)